MNNAGLSDSALRLLIPCCVVVLLCSTLTLACRPREPATVWVAAMLAAERALADSLAVAGMREGMARFLAPASTALGPAPMDGLAWAETQPNDARQTRVRRAHVSTAGDLAFALGWWPRVDSASGHYVNIWQHEATEGWRIACTAWLGHVPTAIMARLDTAEAPGWVRASRKLYQEAARVSMLKADKELARRSLDRSAAWAFDGAAADSIDLLREGLPPIRGREEVLEALKEERGVLSWVPVASHVARSGDLGYTYGFQTHRTDTLVRSRAFLRIWKALPDSSWSVLVHAVTRPIRD